MAQIAALTSKAALLEKARNVEMKEEERRNKLAAMKSCNPAETTDQRRKEEEEFQKDERDRRQLVLKLIEEPSFLVVRDLLCNFEGSVIS